jgi:cyclophilin family peptidyl-prolyl cis-trans isomerase
VVIVGILGLVVAAARSAEPPAEKAGPKTAAFNQLSTEWKKVLAEMRKLHEDYSKTLPEQQPAVEARYAELAKQGEAMLPKLISAAEAAYPEAPEANKPAAHFLQEVVKMDCQNDNYERALRLGKLLSEQGYRNVLLEGLIGWAAFCANDFELSAKNLAAAQENNVFLQLGRSMAELAAQFQSEIPFYREAWAKERKIREAEAKADDLPRVLLKTGKGEIELELLENEAPLTVANFVALVEKKYYDGTPFHRVLPQFMAQGGDPTGTGTGGPGYTIPDECRQPNARVHFRGSMSMANTGAPSTGGSQFFLTFRPTHHLDGRHTVFGRVVQGMDVLAKLQRIDPEQKNAAIEPDKIVEAKVLRKRSHPYEPKKIPERTREPR